MTSDEVKRFPLPEKEPTRYETKRTLVSLVQWEPLETQEEFTERVWREWQEHQAKHPGS
jgi:hypothetical protein